MRVSDLSSPPDPTTPPYLDLFQLILREAVWTDTEPKLWALAASCRRTADYNVFRQEAWRRLTLALRQEICDCAVLRDIVLARCPGMSPTQ